MLSIIDIIDWLPREEAKAQWHCALSHFAWVMVISAAPRYLFVETVQLAVLWINNETTV